MLFYGCPVEGIEQQILASHGTMTANVHCTGVRFINFYKRVEALEASTLVKAIEIAWYISKAKLQTQPRSRYSR